MALYHQSGVSVESFVEMASDVPMRYEIDEPNNQATIHCGSSGQYSMVLSRDNLAQFVAIGGKAMADLDATG